MKLPFSSSVFKLLAACVICMSAQGLVNAQTAASGPAPAADLLQTIPVEPMPSWFADGQPTADARVALDVLTDAASQGLNPADYRVRELAQAFEQTQSAPPAPDDLARIDAALTAALERYLSDLRHGRLSPAVLKHRFKAPASDSAPFDARGYVMQARRAGLPEALNAAQPQVPMYDAIRTEMNRYQAMGDHLAWQTPLPPLAARSLKPGQAWDGLPLMAARLAALGDLDSETQALAMFMAD